MFERGVDDDPDIALVEGIDEVAQAVVATEGRIDRVAVDRVVAVGRWCLEDRVQVDAFDAEAFEMIHPVGDTDQVAALEVEPPRLRPPRDRAVRRAKV